MDFLLKISEFFTFDDEEKKSLHAPSKQVPVKSSSSQRSTTKAATVAVKKESKMTLNLRVEKPDIVLVEHMNSIDTNALFLNVRVCIVLSI